MPRRIRTSALQAMGGSAPPQLDGYFDRIVKYIPSDVVGAWVAVRGVINSSMGTDPNAWIVHWIAFAVGVLLTAGWTWRQTNEPGKRPATVQIALSTVAFIVWVAALGGPFLTVPGYRESYGSLLLIGFTLVVGLVAPRQ